jgi:hypothetical protein
MVLERAMMFLLKSVYCLRREELSVGQVAAVFSGIRRVGARKLQAGLGNLGHQKCRQRG